MGDVYLGIRSDGYEQKVAIKVLRQGMSELVQQRFHRERQILADLRHPNIAQVLDGGDTEVGRPFLVMQYVEGEPIDQYCDKQKLRIPERLSLFLRLCDAVVFAHRHMVIHRDLKPGNILVDRETGQPVLLDFGIAGFLDPEDGGHPYHDG